MNPRDSDIPAYWTVQPNGYVVRLDGWELAVALRALPSDPEPPPRLQGAPSLNARAGWEFRPIAAIGALFQQAGVAPALPGEAPAEARAALVAGVVTYDAAGALAAWKANPNVSWQGDKDPTPIFGATFPARPQPLSAPPRVFLPGPTLLEALAQADLFVPPPSWFPAPPAGWLARAAVKP